MTLNDHFHPVITKQAIGMQLKTALHAVNSYMIANLPNDVAHNAKKGGIPCVVLIISIVHFVNIVRKLIIPQQLL